MSARLDPEHQRFLDDRFEGWRKEQPSAIKLKEILLRIGGQAIVAPSNNYESDLKVLIASGRVIRAIQEIVPMEDNACHVNAANLFRKSSKPNFGIGTGYGLNGGLWRQHTWAMDDNKIVETTTSREIYFGVLYFGKDAEVFCDGLAN